MLLYLRRRRSSSQGLVRRARIVLAASEGSNNEQIAQRLGINRETARLWRSSGWLERSVWHRPRRLGEKALRGCIEEDVLADAPRSGAPATFTPEQVCRIVALACEDPEGLRAAHHSLGCRRARRRSDRARHRRKHLGAQRRAFFGERRI